MSSSSAPLPRSVVSSARQLSVLNMEGNFGSFLTDSFLGSLLAANPLAALATLDISYNDQANPIFKMHKSDF